jgi:heat shock protein HtpX
VLALLALIAWSWIPVGGLLALGCAAALLRDDAGDHRPYWWSSDLASGLVVRLCMRADIQAPDVVVEHGPMATAWTAGGRIHVTRRLVELLDDAELEAVLSHEVAHLARRDAAVMEICSAPGRVLLGFARVIVPWTRAAIREDVIEAAFPMIALGVLCGPPALVIGSISRLSLLGLSRAREFAADAAAATLTGRPSALASALVKLDAQGERSPFVDLRELEPDPVLCIVAPGRSRLRRLISTHPPTAARVRRLQQIEGTIHAHARFDPASW